MRDDPAFPALFTHHRALAAGMTRHQITCRVDSGVWRRLRRGVYCLTATWEAASPEGRAALRGMALVLAHRGEAPFALSHASAAALYGLPVPATALAWVTVAAGFGAHTRHEPDLRQEVAALPPQHIGDVRGWPVTTVARTLADSLRHLPPEAGVAMADAALHDGLVSSEEIRRMVLWQQTWPLAATARKALPLVDGLRESPLESRSAVVMDRYHLPAPLCQVEVRDERDRFLARVDFAWPRFGMVGEADGRSKYGVDAVGAFEAEKDRQAALERLGLVVVRWGARHLLGDPPAMVVRLREALERTRPAGVRGSLAQPKPRCPL